MVVINLIINKIMQNRILIFFVVSLLFCSCNKSKFDVDISDIKVELEYSRLDIDLFETEPNRLAVGVPFLREKYGDFFDLYCFQIVSALGNPNDSTFNDKLKQLITNSDWREVYDETQKKFADITLVTNQLDSAFRYYRYYFPSAKIPKVIMYISVFNQSVVTFGDTIGVGLDKYLGSGCKYYEFARIDKYRRFKMTAEKIGTDCMIALADMKFPYNDSVDNMMSQMIHYGKLMYFADATLPVVADTIKWGYTLRQYSWAVQYEKQIWDHFVEKEMLYSTDVLKVQRQINDAPFTAVFQNNSAPRLGQWLGYLIVHSFMRNNPKISLPELMKNNNYQEIYNKARYNPK